MGRTARTSVLGQLDVYRGLSVPSPSRCSNPTGRGESRQGREEARERKDLIGRGQVGLPTHLVEIGYLGDINYESQLHPHPMVVHITSSVGIGPIEEENTDAPR